MQNLATEKVTQDESRISISLPTYGNYGALLSQATITHKLINQVVLSEPLNLYSCGNQAFVNIVSNFRYYEGSVKIKVEVSCSKDFSGILVMAIVPISTKNSLRMNPTTAGLSLSSLKHVTLNLGSNRLIGELILDGYSINKLKVDKTYNHLMIAHQTKIHSNNKADEYHLSVMVEPIKETIKLYDYVSDDNLNIAEITSSGPGKTLNPNT